MYYRIGSIGRFLWNALALGVWGVTTLMSMAAVVGWGTQLSQTLRLWCRSVGLTPILSDFLNMITGLVGFLLVPFLIAWLVLTLNRFLKGKPHATQSVPRNAAG